MNHRYWEQDFTVNVYRNKIIYPGGRGFIVNKLKCMSLKQSHSWGVFTVESQCWMSERTESQRNQEQNDALTCFPNMTLVTFLKKTDVFLFALRLSHLWMSLCAFYIQTPSHLHSMWNREGHFKEKGRRRNNTNSLPVYCHYFYKLNFGSLFNVWLDWQWVIDICKCLMTESFFVK